MSEIIITPTSILYSGPDAVNLYAVTALRTSLSLYLRTGGRLRPHRGWTLRAALTTASRFTGQRYKASRPEAERAIADLQVWISTMRSALPITESQV